jgi:two-component system, NarL family, invasion response regulator UvrY
MANRFLYDQENIMVLERNLLSGLERNSLKLACTGLTYKEVAIKMILNLRAASNLHDNLFIRLHVKSRLGLVTYARWQGIVCVLVIAEKEKN